MSKSLSTANIVAVGIAVICIVTYTLSLFVPALAVIRPLASWTVIALLIIIGIWRIRNTLRNGQESFELRVVQAGTWFFLNSTLVLQIADLENELFRSLSLLFGLCGIACIMVSDVAVKQNMRPRDTLQNPLIITILLLFIGAFIITFLIPLVMIISSG